MSDENTISKQPLIRYVNRRQMSLARGGGGTIDR